MARAIASLREANGLAPGGEHNGGEGTIMAEVASLGAASDAPAVERRIHNTSEGANISRKEFFEILTAQLTNQDPLDPMDQTEFLGQLTDLESLQAFAGLQEAMARLLQSQQLASGGTLIGRVIRGIGDSGEPIEGVVESVALVSGQVRLMVDGEAVALDKVLEVSGAEQAATSS